jgi:hypothetical protein
MHFILTTDNDLVVFRPIDPSSVFVAGAERSMGSKWRDGIYPVDSSRHLWTLICEEGGTIPSAESQKAVSEDIGRSHREQIDRMIDCHEVAILDLKEAHKRQIKHLEGEVLSYKKEVDDLRLDLERLKLTISDMEAEHQGKLDSLAVQLGEVFLADQAKFSEYEE